MRKVELANNEHYHIFNRGVDKRKIFQETEDLLRFFQSMDEFNAINPIDSIYVNSFRQLRSSTPKSEKLVNFLCYCLNPNHYHFILEQLVDKGIEKFMHRLGTGFTNYFNEKYNRSGSLFQGRYKAIHINSDEYLLHLSAYINLNSSVHQLRSSTPKLSKSSWGEYIDNNQDKQDNQNAFCEKDIILGQFNNPLEYKKFAKSSLKDIKERKTMKELLLE